MPSKVYIWLALLIVPQPALGDYLEIRREANIKETPGGTNVERVAVGTYLMLASPNQINGYYEVDRPTSPDTGFVYRTFGRRFPGDPPEAFLPSDPDDPLTGVVLNQTQRAAADRHLAIGRPRAVYTRIHEGYVAAYDTRLKIPVWVQYQLRQVDLNGPAARTGDFRPDTAIPFGSRSERADYEGSGFDQGHMAPAGDMSRSERAMSDSFLLSNMAPQIGDGYNQHIWANLEAAIRDWVVQRGTLTVITGPIFEPDANNQVGYEVIGNNNVAVPSAFFKVVVDQNTPGATNILAFILSHEDLSGHDFSEFLDTVDAIEAATGLDLLSALPDPVETVVEAQQATNVW